jgi:nicotinic acetylcholine receptor
MTRFLGVNGEGGVTGSGSKWSGDPRASTEILVHIQKTGGGVGMSTTGGTGGLSEDQNQQLIMINYHLTELMDFVKRFRERIYDRDRKESIAKEWKAASLVFDRIFFLVYLIAIITSLCVVLPIISHNYTSNCPTVQRPELV